jgi:uncharacterized protein YecE (DUF72 family)
MADWVRRIDDTWDRTADVYVYFNNDPGGAAIQDAGRFVELARAAGRDTTRTPARAER